MRVPARAWRLPARRRGPRRAQPCAPRVPGAARGRTAVSRDRGRSGADPAVAFLPPADCLSSAPLPVLRMRGGSKYLMNKAPAQENLSPPSGSRPVGSSLRARMRLYALAGFVVVGAWLYFTLQAVFGLYDTTVQIARFTELRERVSDASA